MADIVKRKFGKQIQKRQLEVPEYAASFVNYKALKKASLHHDFLLFLLQCVSYSLPLLPPNCNLTRRGALLCPLRQRASISHCRRLFD